MSLPVDQTAITGDLHFRILDVAIRFECRDAFLRAVLLANFGAFLVDAGPVDIAYRVERTGDAGTWRVRRDTGDGDPQFGGGDDLYSFVYDIEKDITLALQHRRTDLYFIHAAALEYRGRALVLVAESGTGKSTTAWALASHGFGYLSDELAPIDPQSLDVHPYPHALCLKSRPPAPYALPGGLIETELTLHVPAATLPGAVRNAPVRLGAVFFLTRKPDSRTPAIGHLSAGEAGARLYANTLNALAHAGFGLDAALRITAGVPAYLLEIGDLAATSGLIRQTLDARFAGQG